MFDKLSAVKEFVSEYRWEIGFGAICVAIAGAIIAHPEILETEDEPEEKTIVEVHHYYHS